MQSEMKIVLVTLRQRVTVLQAYANFFRSDGGDASYAISLADEVHESLEELEALITGKL